MASRRQSEEIKQDILHVEERLAIIAESQAELNRHTQEIKDLTSNIVKTLDSSVSSDLLVRLAPVIQTIPSLLREMTPNIQSIEARFADIHRGQLQIQNDISRVIALIIDLTSQSPRIS